MESSLTSSSDTQVMSMAEMPFDAELAEPGSQSSSSAKQIDLSKPIELTSETVVVVDGKKCVLRVDPNSNQLSAYPVKSTTMPGGIF